jgi:hypothetical protein
MIQPPEATVAIGIGNGNDVFICRQGRLYLGAQSPEMHIDIRLTKRRVTAKDLDSIIECLERLRIHVDP